MFVLDLIELEFLSIIRLGSKLNIYVADSPLSLKFIDFGLSFNVYGVSV